MALLCLSLVLFTAWASAGDDLDDIAEDAAEEAAEEEAEDAAEEAAEDAAEEAAEEEAEDAAEEAAEDAAEEAAEEEAEDTAEEAAEDAAEEAAEEEAEDAAEEAAEDAAEEAEEAAEEAEEAAEEVAESASDASDALADSYSEWVLDELDDLDFDADQGDFVVRNELLVIADPGQIEALERLPEITLVSREPLSTLGLSLAKFVVREGYRLDSVRETLRRRFPDLSVDFNHGYELAQQSPPPAPTQASVAGVYRQPPPGQHGELRLGMIDSDLNSNHPALKQARITQRRFLDREQSASRQHGTAVASLLVADSPQLSGLLPGAQLYSASVFTEHPEQGLITTTHRLVRGLDWLASEQTEVINISLAGPANRALERVIQALTERDIWLVAAVGNQGPLSPPRYPAAYPGVVGVTAIDTEGQVYRHAGRGPHLDYAAPGVDILAASTRAESGFERVSGTSYATALVTGLVAFYRAETGGGADLDARLLNESVDLGEPGFDPVFGRGLLGKSLLKEP